MKPQSRKRITNLILGVFFAASVMSALGQSSDPDRPTSLSNGSIIGETNGTLSDKKTYYYSFDVKPGTLTLTADMDPVKSTAGGVMYWTYLDSRFKQMKYDAWSAQGGPVRKINDSKVTIKRKIILKLEVEGQMSYKLKFSGTALAK
jgi:hypothetical protein